MSFAPPVKIKTYPSPSGRVRGGTNRNTYRFTLYLNTQTCAGAPEVPPSQYAYIVRKLLEMNERQDGAMRDYILRLVYEDMFGQDMPQKEPEEAPDTYYLDQEALVEDVLDGVRKLLREFGAVAAPRPPAPPEVAHATNDELDFFASIVG